MTAEHMVAHTEALMLTPRHRWSFGFSDNAQFRSIPQPSCVTRALEDVRPLAFVKELVHLLNYDTLPVVSVWRGILIQGLSKRSSRRVNRNLLQRGKG